MGILRLYLALCVVATHSNTIFPWKVHDGKEAVQLFFIISGFYMALIARKYTRATEFYINRFLRIFIPYWFVTLTILLLSVVGGVLFNWWGELVPYIHYSQHENGLAGVLLAGISNITVFFQDVIMFLSHDANETLKFTSNFRESQAPLYKYLIIPQAWSISLELLFYLIVPLLSLMQTRRLILIVLISILLRVFTYQYLGLTNDPWNSRFFPFELALFVLGMVSYRMYERCRASIDMYVGGFRLRTRSQYFKYVLIIFIFFFCAKLAQIFASQSLGYNYATLISCFGWALLLPFIFFISKENKLDRFIGELSYPVYLIHVFVISVVSLLMKRSNVHESLQGEISAVVSICGALILMKILIFPLENRRHSLAKNWLEKGAVK